MKMNSIGHIVNEYLNISTEGELKNPSDWKITYHHYVPTDYEFLEQSKS